MPRVLGWCHRWHKGMHPNGDGPSCPGGHHAHRTMHTQCTVLLEFRRSLSVDLPVLVGFRFHASVGSGDFVRQRISALSKQWGVRSKRVEMDQSCCCLMSISGREGFGELCLGDISGQTATHCCRGRQGEPIFMLSEQRQKQFWISNPETALACL